MCFSASASFGAGIILSVIGVASLKKVNNPAQIVFASVPVIFSIQQITEGFLWLALSDPAYAFLQQFTTVTFLFFAQIVWPIWVPLAIFLLEKEDKRKAFQLLLLGIGTLVSFYLAYCLVMYNVEARIIGYHISYQQDYPQKLGLYGGGLYIAATILPAFLSSVKRTWTLGTAILISYIVTTIFYRDYIVSVWCFFASVISISIFAVLYEMKKANASISTQPS
jgi:hypothetical protein